MSVDLAATSAARWQARRTPGPDADAAAHRRVRIRLGAASRAADAADADLALDDPRSMAARQALDDLISRARTGWRFVLMGDDADTSFVRSLLLRAGGIDEEIEIVDGGGPGEESIGVYCGHCHVRTVTRSAPTVTCVGCERVLTVYYHFSRRQGAYLGYLADAEER